MRVMNRLVIVGTVLLLAATVQAQNPELGDVDAEAEGSIGGDTGGSAQGQWTPPAVATPAGDDDADPVDTSMSSGDSDHSSVVGALGVGFFGVMNLPVMDCQGNALCPAPLVVGPGASVSAPSIGARYWMDEAFAIEAALGLAITSGTFETTGLPGGPAPVELEPSILALALHGGVPLVLAHSGHFAFELVPELNVGFVSGTLSPPGGTETSVSGFLLELGGRVGAEIHFGFIDIPQLALMGSVGVSLRLESRSAEQTGATTAVEQSSTAFGTTVGSDPWDIFTSSITAIYYFGG